MATTQRFLVKVAAGPDTQPLRLGGVELEVRAVPLMPSIDAARKAKPAGLGAAAVPDGAWHVLQPALAADASINPWDVCHEMVRQRMGVAGQGAVAFAEPDLTQQWLRPQPSRAPS